MIVGALVDAGADAGRLTAALSTLGLGPVSLTCEPANRSGIVGTWFRVDDSKADHPGRHLRDILGLIQAAELPGESGAMAERVFDRLAAAEAAVHNTTVDDVHFHEVGAIDSILDVVGACVALELLGVTQLVCSPIATGHGTVTCDHGTFPVPAPATARLLAEAKAPTNPIDQASEVTTPTAAAVLTTLAESFGPMPPMTVGAVGYGAGSRTDGTVPNLLRVFLGQPLPDGAADSVVELAANLDDCTGELIGATIDRLIAAGCLDAWATPATTKKSRPGWVLSALCHPADAEDAERILFAETTTFGVRRRLCRRRKLARRHETVETPYGPIRIKLGCRGDEVVTASPEFEDCRAAADSHHASVKDVMAAATNAYQRAGD